MNGFKMMADSYRKLVNDGTITEEQAKRDIEIYDFLATCDNDDFCRMVDSSAFNDIIRAFLHKAVKDANVTKKTEEKLLGQLRYLFDEMTAKEVLNRYYEN